MKRRRRRRRRRRTAPSAAPAETLRPPWVFHCKSLICNTEGKEQLHTLYVVNIRMPDGIIHFHDDEENADTL